MKNRTRKSRAPRPSRQRRRRGVLLIVVLSLLVLFALIGFTFIMVAGQYSRAARTNVRVGLFDDQGEEIADLVIYDLIRGTTNPNSMLINVDPGNAANTICHSLLEDVYGNGGVRGTVDGVDSTTFPGFAVLTVSGPLVARSDYYSGQVLSMLDGPCGFLSSRIVRYDHANNQLLVEAFQHESGIAIVPAVGNTFLINGRPFSGIAGNAANGIFGSANESYDAPDANNPHLAFVPTSAANPNQIIASFVDRPAAGAVFRQDADNNGVWDLMVDNDRDGILDGLWLDFGLAMKTAPNGVRYKPFVSVLCIDMDGRVNINAHGSLAQTHANYNAASSETWANANNSGFYSSSGPSSLNIRPRGLGYGPAEINFSTLVGSIDYQGFLQERYRSGAAGDQVAGINGIDPLVLLENPSVPNDFAALATTPGGYGDWVDMHGQAMIGLDVRGQPLTIYAGAGQMTNPPYEMNLVDASGGDTPYTATDLEAVLRWRDVDKNSHSKRIATFSPTLLASQEARRSITTASFSMPVPATPVHIIDRFATRMTEAGGSYDAAAIQKMIPFELLHGTKMDINRLWGNSIDNNTNTVVDDLNELGTVETIFADVYPTPPQANYVNNMDAALTLAGGRHLYARNLFCLMMFLMDKDPGDANRIAYRIPLTGAPFGVIESGLTDAQHYELTVRRIAQWCINVVDFRDPDAIMTPFEYDLNPFNGWNVDGVVDNGSGSISADDAHAERRLVWGCEYPDVLMTESLAFHDRRVRDTEWDDYSDAVNEDAHATPTQGSKRIHAMDPGDNSKKGDKDLDQVRIPQGSLFLEFHCTRNTATNNPVFPKEIYNAAGQLDLARKDAATSTVPVWRVAISASHHSGTTNHALSHQQRRASRPDTTTFDPADMSLINDTDILPIERYVWFTSTAPPVANLSGEVPANTFYNKTNRSALVAPGEYLVVGPRQDTYIGSKPTSSEAPDPVVTSDADQKIDLNAGGAIDYTDLDGVSAYPLGPNVTPAQIAAPSTIFAVTDAPGYPGAVSGLNVTEPLPTATNKYPDPTHARNGVQDAYGDGTTPTYLDEPLDSRDGRPLSDTVDNIADTQTVSNYRTAILQRLANPLLPWHVLTNPYITIDWIPIDVTIFNGEDRKPDTWDDSTYGEFDDDDTNPQTPRFGSRERSSDRFNYYFWNPAVAPAGAFNPLIEPAGSTPTAAADECFQYDLIQAISPRDVYSNSTLGYLNSGFHGSPFLPPIPGPLTNPAGAPPQAVPWLTWLNRPYANHYELMLVPFSSQGQLLHQFSGQKFDFGPVGPIDPTFEFRLPYAHLMNFYHTGSTGGITAPHFYRLLEYTEVPSRFVGTHKWYQPIPANPIGTFNAPFHKLSRFRDPGLINVNTIPGPEVWTTVAENEFSSWANVDSARRDPAFFGPADPSGRFSNPFRSAWSAAGTTDASNTMLRWSANAFGPLMSNRQFGFSKHIEHGPTAYFFMQGLTRQASMLTTQSNVYAIWVTVGYFEVDEAGAPTGREVGQDTGEVHRHRSFYMIDRSIPVAYERGRNHNVDRTILLQRHIE